MPRTYSKTGCSRCKLRRVKCGEERPVCSACAKWNWPCVYPGSRSCPSSSTKAHTDTSLAALARPLGLPRCCGNEMEGRFLRDIPYSIRIFFSPTSGNQIQDLQIMWQLMASNELLRHAGIACFSALAENTIAVNRLNQETYGKALQSLRSKVLCKGLDQENIICVMASVVFLGKMESFGSQATADALQHWVALIPLLGADKAIEVMERRVLPLSESMLIFESLLYHMGTHGMFSQITGRAWSLWQAHGMYRRLCTLNPVGPDRLSHSPLLSGQYELYDMALQVTHLLQTHQNRCIPSGVANAMEVSLRRKDIELNFDFTVAESDVILAAKYNAERAIYHLFCNSLLICITAMRESSQAQQQQMQTVVKLGMEMYLDLPVYGEMRLLALHANHFMLAAIWPILVLGCAIYDMEQFEVFMDHYSKLEQFLDAGRQRRGRSLLRQVSEILSSSSVAERSSTCTKSDGKPIPAGLIFLRYGGEIKNVEWPFS